MNKIVEINKKQAIILYLKGYKTEIIAIIDNEPGLIKHLLEIFEFYELTNINGYLKFENRNNEVYLHRIIINYYSKFNNKLSEIVNSKYEINHKNFNKWDNRLENLELVTRKGNECHKRGLNYNNEVIMTSEELVNIQNDRKKKRQYYMNKNFLEKRSELNKNIGKVNMYALYRFLYVIFNNVNECETLLVKKRSNINSLKCMMSDELLSFINAQHNCLVDMYDRYRAITIMRKNRELLLYYYDNVKCFKELCDKYLTVDNVVWLFNFFCNKGSPKYYYTFYKNQLCFTFSINSVYIERGKYNNFRVLYYTGLFKRAEAKKMINQYGDIRSSSKIIIPRYTKELFKTEILPNTKHFLESKLTTITYSIIAYNEGKDVADKVYKNPILAQKYERDKVTIKDLEEIICSTNIVDKINKYGFIKVKDIREELKIVNNIRAQKGEEHFDISGEDDKFIKKMIRNIQTIKTIMKNCGYDYVIMNKKTKEKIENYQKRNNILFCEDLKFNQNERVFVLNKLYVKPPKRKSTKKSVSQK